MKNQTIQPGIGIFAALATGVAIFLFLVIAAIAGDENLAIQPLDPGLANQAVEPGTSLATISLPGTDEQITAELAVTPEQISSGLMNRQSLGNREGMLFVFPEPRQANFWMKDTLISLDIIFIDENQRVVNIARNTTPLDEKMIYSSQTNVLYVLEVNAGVAAELGLMEGSQLEIPNIKL